MKYKLDFRTFSNALKENRLLGLKCCSCETITCPPKMVCCECTGIELDIVELSGRGKIKTFTTTFVAPSGREVEAPYTIVIVELEEGPWLTGNLIDMDPAKVTMDIIDRPVTLGHKIFPGDLYARQEATRPLFSLA